MAFKKLEREYDTLYLQQWEYYRKKAPESAYIAKPLLKKILDSDIKIYLAADPEMGRVRSAATRTIGAFAFAIYHAEQYRPGPRPPVPRAKRRSLHHGQSVNRCWHLRVTQGSDHHNLPDLPTR